MDPLIAMLPVLPLPDVPAVDPVEPALAPGLVVEPVEPLRDAVLPVELELPEVEPEAPEPMCALVNMNCPLRPALVPAVVDPAVPLVPVAPEVLPPPCRQPVTVMLRLLLLPEV